MKIPQPIETLFDQFPLKTLPKQVIDSNAHLEKFYFLKKTQDLGDHNPLSSFLLAVHNVREVQINSQESRFLATDPASLADALILCYNHSLRLPRASKLSQSGNLPASLHSMVPMSYLASPNNQLPILIETLEETTKCITTSSKISSSIASKSFAQQGIDSMVNFYMDNLQTLWVFTILHEISFSNTEVLHLVFYDRSDISAGSTSTNSSSSQSCTPKFSPSTPNTHPNVLDNLQLIDDLQKWCSFKDKYNHLYSGQAESIRAPITVLKHLILGPKHAVSSESFKKAYASEIAEFFKILPLAAKYIREKEEGTQQVILEIKLASFILCCIYFLPTNSVIKTILSKDFEDLILWSSHVILKY